MKISKSLVLKMVVATSVLLAMLLATALTTADVAKADAKQIVLYSALSAEEFSIVAPHDANETEIQAAELLKSYLTQITGVAPAITDADETDLNVNKHVVINMTAEAYQVAGGYVLRCGKSVNQEISADKNLYIESPDARGIFNGVYEFLRRFCGVNVYSADVKTIPAADQICVSDEFYLKYTPALEYAHTDWISPNTHDFALANGLNGSNSPLSQAEGGKVNYITFCHSLTGSIVPASELFASHPEYFALTKSGQREATQLCLSNPAVVERAKADVINLINNSYSTSAALNIISVTQADNQDYCLCPNCTQIANTYGGQSGLMLWFVNQIADYVLTSSHPDVVVDTFAYQYTRHTPTGIVPRDNVCVRLCSIECCFAHTLEDPSCKENAAFITDLKNWSEICSRMYIWDYTTNYIQTIGLFPDFGTLQANIKTFVKYNVVGIYEEGNYYASSCNSEFADLRAYLLARYMYDPYNDYGTIDDETINGFLRAYYGEGWQEIAEFLNYITVHAGSREDGHLFIYNYMITTLHGVTAKDVKKLNAMWDDAEKKTSDAGNTAALKRIQRSRLSWEYYLAVNEYGDYSRNLNVSRWLKASTTLIENLKKAGVTRYNEGRDMNQLYVYAISNPGEWDSFGILLFYCISLGILAIILLQALAFAIMTIVKKRLILLVIPLITILTLCLAVWTRHLFVHGWDQVVPFIIANVIMNPLVGALYPIAKYSANGFKLRGVKSTLIDWAIGTAIATVPYVTLMTVFERFITDTCPSVPSATIAFLWYGVIIMVTTFIAQNKMFATQPKTND